MRFRGNIPGPVDVCHDVVVDRPTRRNLLLFLSGFGVAPAQQIRKRPELPRVGEFVRYVDPVTESTLVRLTSLASVNRLPAPQNAFISTRNRFLIFSSDRTGQFMPHLVDLRTGAVRQVAETAALDPHTLTLDQSERLLFFLDGGTLKQVQISNRRINLVSEGVSGFSGRSENTMVVVRERRLERLKAETLAEDVSGPCHLSPDGAFCLFHRAADAGCELWCVPVQPRGEPKMLAAGRVRFPFWSPDSRTVLFLRDVQRDAIELSEIHRVFVDGTAEEKVAVTSQFDSFAPNSDATVFVGASRSKAQPTVDLLLRSAKREMTLCEHHSSEASGVTPVFAPDSRRVYFQSDREGKPALYSINVELLVEPTVS